MASFEQEQTVSDEELFSHLELSAEVNGMHAVTIRRQGRSEASMPNPPYSILQQGFEIYGEDGVTPVGKFRLDWHSPQLLTSSEQFGTFEIGGIQLEDDFMGRSDELGRRTRHGIGKDLYRHIATRSVPPDGMRFEEQDLPYYLVANIQNLNKNSRGMWRSLFKSGEAMQWYTGYYFFKTPTLGGLSRVQAA